VTTPVLAPTVATDVLVLDQLELVVKSSTVPSAYVALACNCTVPFTATENGSASTSAPLKP